MNQSEISAPLARLHEQMKATIDELRTMSKATMPDTPQRQHVLDALRNAEATLQGIRAALSSQG